MKATLLPVLSCGASVATERAWLRRHPGEQARLMARAASAVAAASDLLLAGVKPRSILVVAGKGHNGADALLAGLKFNLGTKLIVVLAEDNVAAGLPQRILAQARRRHASVLTWKQAQRSRPKVDLIIDGLLGVGFKPPLRAQLAAVIRWVNTLSAPVISVDLPSGVGDTTDSPSVHADLTVSLGSLKAPLLRPRVLAHAGRLRVADLGIDLPTGKLTAATLKTLIPLTLPRSAKTDKRRQGRVVIVGGSAAMPGAVLMNTRACLAAGAGLVTVIAPESLRARAAIALPEAMWQAQGTAEAQATLQRLGKIWEVVLMGSGLGARGQTLAQAAARATRGVAILDADALRPACVRAAQGATARILLPHAGECLRLGARQATPAEAQRLALRYRAVVVLKGPLTCVTDGVQTCYIPHGGPILARGGSGDLLAGMVAAVVAARTTYKLNLFSAVVTAVTWQGAAADELARTEGETSVRTTQLLAGLSPALRRARA